MDLSLQIKIVADKKIKFIFCFLLFCLQIVKINAQELEWIRQQEKIRDSLQQATRASVNDSTLSDAAFRHQLDSVFYLAVYQDGRFKDIDTGLLNYYRFYDLQNRYDLISIGGLNTVSRPFSLLKNQDIGFQNQFLLKEMYQEIPFIQTYRPISKLYFSNDAFPFPINSRNTNQVNFQHFQPLGQRVSFVLLWNVLGTSGYTSESRQELTQFGGRLYFRDLSGQFWSINDYYYQAEDYRLSGGLTDQSMQTLVDFLEVSEGQNSSALGERVRFYGLDNYWIRQKIKSDNYWIFSKKNEVRYFDPQHRSYLRYQFRYDNGQAVLAGVNSGGNSLGYAQYAQIPSALNYVADFRKTENFQNELTLQAAFPVFTPLFFSTLQLGFEHQAGRYVNRYYQGANAVDMNFTYNNNWLLKTLIRWEIGPFLADNQINYGFAGYSQGDFSSYTRLGLFTKYGGNLIFSHRFQVQHPAFEDQKFNSSFISYDHFGDTPKERWRQYQLRYQHTVDQKIVKNNLDVSVDYVKYFHYLTLDALGNPLDLGRFRYLEFKVNHHLGFWKFGIRNEFSSYLFDKNIDLSLPTWVYRGSFYYQDRFFKKALGFQTGVDFTYYNSYSPWDFVPARADFSPFALNPLGFESGNYPFLDVYVAFKIGQARISLKYTNAVFGWNDTFIQFNQPSSINYYSAKGYLFNETVVRFTIDWILEY